MAYEYACPVILMLAKCVEDDKQKCHKYWPTEKAKLILADNFDAMDILHVSEEVHKGKSAISVRHIELTRRDRKNNDIIGKHTVKIVHFQGWPDFGVPDVSSFRAVQETVNTYVKDAPEPIVVHCSAGVGRTGTFCAIDVICKQMDVSTDLTTFEYDLFTTVKKLKLARMGMVQTKEQYLYCYKVLADEAMNRGVKFAIQ
jgi:protein tyrosine phosphatase